MFRPDAPLAPPRPTFDEPWQAQALALADAMVQAGRFGASEWGDALGRALREAEADGAPDSLETYYAAVLAALERLCASYAGISDEDRAERRRDWEAAYRGTPHGQPVELSVGRTG